MKTKETAILAAIALAPGACAIDPGVDPKAVAQRHVDQITIVYAGVRSAAAFCTSGVLCPDAGVIEAVQAGLAKTDIAVAEATKLILANATDTSAVSKYAAYALAAIEVLTKVLQSFGVKVA